MAGNGNAKKKTPPGWGDDQGAASPAPENAEDLTRPLTEKEIVGLRAVLDRHGFDRDKGTF